jgi:hypothetical protein
MNFLTQWHRCKLKARRNAHSFPRRLSQEPVSTCGGRRGYARHESRLLIFSSLQGGLRGGQGRQLRFGACRIESVGLAVCACVCWRGGGGGGGGTRAKWRLRVGVTANRLQGRHLTGRCGVVADAPLRNCTASMARMALHALLRRHSAASRASAAGAGLGSAPGAPSPARPDERSSVAFTMRTVVFAAPVHAAPRRTRIHCR